MTEPTPINPTNPATEYTHEQYEEYLRYQKAQAEAPKQGPMAGLSKDMLQGTVSKDTVESGTALTADVTDTKETVKETVKNTVKDTSRTFTNGAKDATDTAKENAKDTPKDAKDTAAAMFGEVKSAVSGASKREPYAFLALASAAFTVVWLVWRENKEFGAETLKLWTVFVLASVALLFAPIVKKVLRIDATRAWQFAVGGASGLGFAWVAFLLPNISSNQAFFGTLAVAAGGLAAWTAPGRPE
jgi:hypothetical protein